MKKEQIKWRILRDEAVELTYMEMPKRYVMPSSRERLESLKKERWEVISYGQATNLASSARWVEAITNVRGVPFLVKGYVGKVPVRVSNVSTGRYEYKTINLTVGLELNVKEHESLKRIGFASDLESANQAIAKYLSSGKVRLNQEFWKHVESQIAWVDPKMVRTERAAKYGNPVLYAFFGNFMFEITDNPHYRLSVRDSRHRFLKEDGYWEEYFPFGGNKFENFFRADSIGEAKRAVSIIAAKLARKGIKGVKAGVYNHVLMIRPGESPKGLSALESAEED